MSTPKIALIRTQAAVAASLMLASCGVCGNVRVQTVTSPDGTTQATFFVRDCHTSSISIVNLQAADVEFNAGQGRVFLANGKQNVSVEWTGPRTLLVKCSSCSREDVSKANNALGDIGVRYVFGSPAGTE